MSFRSQRHQLFTIKHTKRSLSPFNDKRFILNDGYTTRAHGHWRNGSHRESRFEQVSTTEPMDVDIVEEDTMSEPMDIDVGDTVSEPMDIDPPTGDVSSVANTTTLPVIPPPPAIIPSSQYSYLSS